MKKVIPVRMIRNRFFHEIQRMEEQCASVEELKKHLGRGRAKRGIFEGDLDEGELEIGQVSGLIREILPAADVFDCLIREYLNTVQQLNSTQTQFNFDVAH